MSINAPSEDEINTYGSMVAAAFFGSTVLDNVLLTVQFLLVSWSVTYFLRTPPKKRRGHVAFIIVSCLILATSALETCIDTWKIYTVLYRGGPTGKSYIFTYGEVLEEKKTMYLRLIGDLSMSIVIVAGDFLMLWRCFILWKSRKWVVIIPSLTCLGCFACNVLASAWGFSEPLSRRGSKPLTISVALGVATNIMITLLILLRLALVWKQTRQAFPGRRPPTVYTNIAVILIEAATPLAIFGICLVVARGLRFSSESGQLLQKGKGNIFTFMIASLYYGFCALAPQMIIYRVTSGQSWKGGSDTYGGGEESLSRPQFARSSTEGDGSEAKDVFASKERV